MPKGAIYGKVIIEGKILCMSGIRVGANADVIEIGGVDMPVVRDPVTEEPYLPGSSIRGKLRSLMEKRRYSEALEVDSSPANGFFNKNLASPGAPLVRHHECSSDDCLPCRIFGVSREGRSGHRGNGSGDTVNSVKDNRPGRLIVRDCYLLNADELAVVTNGLYTEIKDENALDRITAAASPRQVERVPRGAKFSFGAIYTVDSMEEARDDLRELIYCLRLLQDDYLGGCGSRGCGEITFCDLSFRWRAREFYEGRTREKVEPVNLDASSNEIQRLIESTLGG